MIEVILVDLFFNEYGAGPLGLVIIFASFIAFFILLGIVVNILKKKFKKIKGTKDEDSENEEEEDNIKKEKVKKIKEPKDKVAKDKTESTREAYHLTKRKIDEKWVIKKEGSNKISQMFDKFEDAYKRAVELSDTNGILLVVHRADGTIRRYRQGKES